VVHPDLLLMDEPFSALDVLTAETLRTDLVDLWVEGRLPIKSVLMVTHNIEEAVLMCDRILVFSSNPGRVAAEIKVDMPHPRNRLDPAFRQLVDSIYARMTKRAEPKVAATGGIPGTGVGMVLHHVSSNVLSGMIETLAAPPYNGHADLPVLAGALQFEADEILHLGESLQLLRFAQLSEGDLMLTEAGKRFANLETDARKKMFAQHLTEYVPVVGLIRRVLDERPSHVAPGARFRNELEDYMSEEDADDTLKTIVSWGRYAELFAYDEQSETFSLENPH
jgi:NitT/TauT family transport system ATP-binding protein